MRVRGDIIIDSVKLKKIFDAVIMILSILMLCFVFDM